MFSIKDQDYFGITNQYVADCFMSFREIEQSNTQQQVHLKLNRPTSLGKRHSFSIQIFAYLFISDFQRLIACAP